MRKQPHHPHSMRCARESVGSSGEVSRDVQTRLGVTGVVGDSSRAAVGNGTERLTTANEDAHRKTLTSGNGDYEFLNTKPGTYVVSMKPAFSTGDYNFTGNFTGSPWADFLLGIPASAQIAVVVSDIASR